MCLLNLKLASDIGNKDGYNLSQLFQSWVQGVNVSKQYSGIYLKALERLTTALLQFGVAIILFVAVYTYQAIRKRNMRILEKLRHHGVISNLDK